MAVAEMNCWDALTERYNLLNVFFCFSLWLIIIRICVSSVEISGEYLSFLVSENNDTHTDQHRALLICCKLTRFLVNGRNALSGFCSGCFQSNCHARGLLAGIRFSARSCLLSHLDFNKANAEFAEPVLFSGFPPNPDKPEIPKFKTQIPNKSQTTNDNVQSHYCQRLEFRTLAIGYYLRFVFCHFGFSIFTYLKIAAMTPL